MNAFLKGRVASPAPPARFVLLSVTPRVGQDTNLEYGSAGSTAFLGRVHCSKKLGSRRHMKRGQEGQPQAPKLLNRRDIDIPDDLESAWKSCWTDLQGKIGNLSEAEAAGYLQIRVGKDYFYKKFTHLISRLFFRLAKAMRDTTRLLWGFCTAF